jgi:hypothetical protein
MPMPFVAAILLITLAGWQVGVDLDTVLKRATEYVTQTAGGPAGKAI